MPSKHGIRVRFPANANGAFFRTLVYYLFGNALIDDLVDLVVIDSDTEDRAVGADNDGFHSP